MTRSMRARARRSYTQRLQRAGLLSLGAGLLMLVLPFGMAHPALHSALTMLRPLAGLLMLGGGLALGLPQLFPRLLPRLRPYLAQAGLVDAVPAAPVRRGAVLRDAATSNELPFLVRHERTETPAVARPEEPLDRFFARLHDEDAAPAGAPRPVAEAAQVAEGGPASTSPPARVAPEQWGPQVLALIEWRRFEALLEAVFAQAGFITRSQSHGADGGVDIWLHSRHQAHGAPVSVVRCTHGQGLPVGVDQVRELRGVMAAGEVRRGQLASTSRFTTEAIAFARANSINLLDSDALLALIAKRDRAQQAALLAVALEGEYWRPTCVHCGVKMLARQARESGRAFWGCVNFPGCRRTMAMRADD